MDLAKSLARRGAVGGTARWAADCYKALRAPNPDLSDNDIFTQMIAFRHAVMPDPKCEGFLYSIVDHLTGLDGLVVAILTVEAGFTENADSVQAMFLDVIREELSKKGIPQGAAAARTLNENRFSNPQTLQSHAPKPFVLECPGCGQRYKPPTKLRGS